MRFFFLFVFLGNVVVHLAFFCGWIIKMVYKGHLVSEHVSVVVGWGVPIVLFLIFATSSWQEAVLYAFTFSAIIYGLLAGLDGKFFNPKKIFTRNFYQSQ